MQSIEKRLSSRVKILHFLPEGLEGRIPEIPLSVREKATTQHQRQLLLEIASFQGVCDPGKLRNEQKKERSFCSLYRSERKPKFMSSPTR
jgi:hypothetical protein